MSHYLKVNKHFILLDCHLVYQLLGKILFTYFTKYKVIFADFLVGLGRRLHHPLGHTETHLWGLPVGLWTRHTH